MDTSSSSYAKIPVTVLTGFLGTGKTTLLNQILKGQHGKRIAVIENEFGEIGIDQEIVINAEEEIFEMNNGCICCTVRGDLIRILSNLAKRKNRFDSVIIETTGMADPGPVAQTFFIDEEIAAKYRLDGIVTVVDAKHIWLHFDTSEEAKQQLAFADVILINKTDLVEKSSIAALEKRIDSLNPIAKRYSTVNGNIDLNNILSIGGFDLERALKSDKDFLKPEYPFEWGGLYFFEQRDFTISFNPGPDESIKILLADTEIFKSEGQISSQSQFQIANNDLKKAIVVFSDFEKMSTDKTVTVNTLHKIVLQTNRKTEVILKINKAGYYYLFMEHCPEEFDVHLSMVSGNEQLPLYSEYFKPDHEHEEEISSVGISSDSLLDLRKVNVWLSSLLSQKGNDIYRSKGILNIEGEDNKLLFQGVHMLLETSLNVPWGSSKRENNLIFIGKNLDRDELTNGFNSCTA
jgi:G3E family GTPase